MRYCLFILLLALSSFSARSDEIKSLYTSVEVEKCKFIASAKPGDGEWSRWRCEGLDGIDVYVTEDDLRYHIGFREKEESIQTLSPFNNIGKSLEWRARQVGDGWEPYATILRYYTTGHDGKKGQILVVSRYFQRETCHIAYIDALANKDANQLARFAADKMAGNFDCSKDKPVVMGNSGVSPM